MGIILKRKCNNYVVDNQLENFERTITIRGRAKPIGGKVDPNGQIYYHIEEREGPMRGKEWKRRGMTKNLRGRTKTSSRKAKPIRERRRIGKEGGAHERKCRDHEMRVEPNRGREKPF